MRMIYRLTTRLIPRPSGEPTRGISSAVGTTLAPAQVQVFLIISVGGCGYLGAVIALALGRHI